MATAAVRRKYRTPGVVNGSLAYDFDALERQLERTGRPERDFAYAPPMEETPADVIARAHESAKARVRPAQHLSAVMVLGFTAAAVMMVLLVLSYVELTGISSSVVQMRQQAAQLQEQQVALMNRYEQAFDLTSVKEQALAAGMSLPSESQIYYIDLSDPDSVEVYEPRADGLAGVLEQVEETVRAAVAYFR